MSEKAFRRAIAVITVAGCISSILLVIITALLYKDCSIISFIANGR